MDISNRIFNSLGVDVFSERNVSHGSSSTQSPSSEIPPTTRRSTSLIVLQDYNQTQTQRSEALRTCLASITNVSGCGRSLAQRRSRATIGVTATGWHSLERLLRELHTRAKLMHSRLPREPTPGWSATRTQSATLNLRCWLRCEPNQFHSERQD